jgi:phage tail sheath gpL-like
MGGGTQIRKPEVTVTKAIQATEISNAPQKILLIGQKTSAGSATAGALKTDVPNDAVTINSLFGARSMLAGMARAIREENKETRVDAIVLDDAGGGVAAHGTVAFTGTSASAAGEIIVTVGSRSQHQYTLTVDLSDTPTNIGDDLVAQITADTNAPFTAVNTTGSVAITCANDGVEGNAIGLEYTGAATGITVTLTAFASGATNPTLTSILDLVGDERYQTIVFPQGYGATFIGTWIFDRWNVSNAIKDGIAIYTMVDTLANCKAAANALNNMGLVLICDKAESTSVYKAPAMHELSYIKSARVAALRALRLTQDADLSDIIVQKDAALDLIGGAHMASFPYFNTPLYNLSVVDIDKGFTQDEIEELNTAGGSVIGNNLTNNTVLMGEIKTTRKTDAVGNAETFLQNLEAVDTASAAAEYFFNNIKSDFVQSRLTNGALSRGHALVNPKSFKAKMIEYYNRLASEDYLLLEDSETARAKFEDEMTVEFDLGLGKITMSGDLDIVSQLRKVIAVLSFGYSS